MKMHHDDANNVPTTPTQNGEATSKHSKLLHIKEKAKEKTKEVLHMDAKDQGERSSYNAGIEELNESPAFNPSKFLNRARIEHAGLPAQVISTVQSTAAAIINPKKVIKSQATKKTAGTLAKSRPYLSRKADLDFLEAHDDLVRAEDSRGEEDGEEHGKRSDINQCEEHFEELEKRRQSMRVAWMTARHVQRVRVVDPIAPPFPDDSFFEQQDDCGFTEFNWGKWIAYKLLIGSHNFTAQYIDDFDELPFDIDTLRRHIERLIIVSAPLQTFISEVRCIYRWEDPVRTGKWMALYFFFWYISYIMTFVYGYVFYKVAMNYYYPTSLEELRKEIERTIDRGATAFKVGELMDKHGSDDWLGPLMDELGPYIQVQIADLVSFLEAAYNFYHFRSPSSTLASMSLFAAFFMISAFTDARFSLKVFWFIVGITFFICWPISSLYPRFRLLVSPFKWALWDVPTHAEWCLQYLQERSAYVKQTMLSHEYHASTNISTDSESLYSAIETGGDDQDVDMLSFGCTYHNTPGHLILSTSSVRFVSLVGSTMPSKSFHEPFSSLVEMSKRQIKSSILSPLAKATTGMDKLEMQFKPLDIDAMKQNGGHVPKDRVVLLENMTERDKAFNAVVGFSGLRWQHLQPRSSPRKSHSHR